ncbi:MAG: barstar family protein [Bacteroidetes bacterium]|nr:barstar family protein [Bacteroidota bacterium]
MKIVDHPPAFSPAVFVAEIDGTKARTLRAFYPRIAKVLHFPAYFGKNLDALFDCLCSLEVTGKHEVVLLIHHPHSFLEKEKHEKKEAALQVLRDAEKSENRYDGIKFSVIGVRKEV